MESNILKLKHVSSQLNRNLEEPKNIKQKANELINSIKYKIKLYKNNSLFIQRKISDSCITRSITTGIGGGIIGFFFSLLSFNYKYKLIQNNSKFIKYESTKITEFRNYFKNFYNHSKLHSVNWAKFSFCFSLSECLIAKKRAKDDKFNSIYAACITGGLFGSKGGLASSITGCAGFAAFTALIEELTYINEKRRSCKVCIN